MLFLSQIFHDGQTTLFVLEVLEFIDLFLTITFLLLFA